MHSKNKNMHKWRYCVCATSGNGLVQTRIPHVCWWWERVNEVLIPRIWCGQIEGHMFMHGHMMCNSTQSQNRIISQWVCDPSGCKWGK